MARSSKARLWIGFSFSPRRLKRGVFRSVVDLQAAINRFIAETNQQLVPVLPEGQKYRKIHASLVVIREIAVTLVLVSS